MDAVYPTFDVAVKNKGVKAMAIVTMEMKQRVMYVSRELLFKDVTFKIVLTPAFIYGNSVKRLSGPAPAFWPN